MSLFTGEKPTLGTSVVKPSGAADVALTVQAGDSGQTANLIEVKNSAGTVVYSVSNAGAVAPAGNETIASGKTLAVTSADKLTVGGVIVPQGEPFGISIQAASQAVNQTCFVADAAYQVTGVNAVWGVASSSGTVAIEKLTGTTAPGSGTTMLTGTISTAATANTVTAGTLTGTVGTLQLAAGDRIGLVFSGTETNLVGLCVVVSLKRI